MDSVFIPAVCPNCGGKLDVNPSADTMICQFCGTEHLIRRNVSGAVQLEAYARCPLCKRNDRAEKVTAIIKNQTAESEGVVPQQQVFTNSAGKAYTRTVNVTVKSVQTSELARHLSPPAAPSTQAGSRSVVVWMVLGIIGGILGLCGFALAIIGAFSVDQSSNVEGAILTSLICGLLPILFSAGMFVLWYFQRKKKQAKDERERIEKAGSYLLWQQAMANWQKLYYCGRDDIIFIPGKKTCAPANEMVQYIYSVPQN